MPWSWFCECSVKGVENKWTPRQRRLKHEIGQPWLPPPLALQHPGLPRSRTNVHWFLLDYCRSFCVQVQATKQHENHIGLPTTRNVDQLTHLKVTFSVSGYQIKRARMMDPHFSSQFESVLASMTKVTVGTFATQAISSSSCNEMVKTERKVIAPKVTAPTVWTIMYPSTLFCLPFLIQKLEEDHDGWDVFPFSYTELLSKLPGPHASVPQKLLMIRVKILG